MERLPCFRESSVASILALASMCGMDAELLLPMDIARGPWPIGGRLRVSADEACEPTTVMFLYSHGAIPGGSVGNSTLDAADAGLNSYKCRCMLDSAEVTKRGGGRCCRDSEMGSRSGKATWKEQFGVI